MVDLFNAVSSSKEVLVSMTNSESHGKNILFYYMAHKFPKRHEELVAVRTDVQESVAEQVPALMLVDPLPRHFRILVVHDIEVRFQLFWRHGIPVVRAESVVCNLCFVSQMLRMRSRSTHDGPPIHRAPALGMIQRRAHATLEDRIQVVHRFDSGG